MTIEIRKGKTINLGREYVIEDLDINAHSGEICAVLKSTENDLLISIPIHKICNALSEQRKKKNIEEQKTEPKPTETEKPKSIADEIADIINETIDEELLIEAKRRVEIVKAAMKAKSTKEKEEIAKKYNVNIINIYRWMKKYKESGKTICGLIPKQKRHNNKQIIKANNKG
jgi:putative transposase